MSASQGERGKAVISVSKNCVIFVLFIGTHIIRRIISKYVIVALLCYARYIN